MSASPDAPEGARECRPGHQLMSAFLPARLMLHAPIRSFVLSTEHDDAPLLASLRRWDDFHCNSVGAGTSYGSRQEPDVDMFALMSGRCSTLRIAGSLAEDGQ